MCQSSAPVRKLSTETEALGDGWARGYFLTQPLGAWSSLLPFLLFVFILPLDSGRVAKEVMESSAKIKREPPEIHR